MPYMPIAILPLLLLGLASTALLFGGAYLVYEWWTGAMLSIVALASGAAMIAISALGRFVVLGAHRSKAEAPSWQHETHFVKIKRPDGTRVHVELSGPVDAPPIVLTHGWGCDNRVFYYTKRELSAKYRVLAWDLRGLGQSSRAAKNDYSLSAMADDLAAVLDLAQTPAVVVGHSIGGMIAQVFARRHAERLSTDVLAFALVNTTYTDPTRTTTAARAMHFLEQPLFVPLMYLTIFLSPVLWAMNWLAYLNGTQIIATALTGFGGSESSQELDFASRFFVKASPAVLARGMLAMFKFDEVSSIGNIKAPVLVVSGDRDPVLLPSASERIVDVTDGSLWIQQNSKHMGFLEHHRSFGEELAKFIEANVNRPSRLTAAASDR